MPRDAGVLSPAAMGRLSECEAAQEVLERRHEEGRGL